MNKDMTPKNKEGQRHGLWEHYYSNGNLTYKGNYTNGEADGYWEFYNTNGKLESKEYFI